MLFLLFSVVVIIITIIIIIITVGSCRDVNLWSSKPADQGSYGCAGVHLLAVWRGVQSSSLHPAHCTQFSVDPCNETSSWSSSNKSWSRRSSSQSVGRRRTSSVVAYRLSSSQIVGRRRSLSVVVAARRSSSQALFVQFVHRRRRLSHDADAGRGRHLRHSDRAAAGCAGAGQRRRPAGLRPRLRPSRWRLGHSGPRQQFDELHSLLRHECSVSINIPTSIQRSYSQLCRFAYANGLRTGLMYDN